MLGGRSIPLVRVFGIRIGVDPSWFLVLFLVIWGLTYRMFTNFQKLLEDTADPGSRRAGPPAA